MATNSPGNLGDAPFPVPNDLNKAKRLNGLNDLNGFFLLLLIVLDAMRKAFKDAQSHREYKSSPAKTPIRLCPKKMKKAIRKMPEEWISAGTFRAKEKKS